MWQVERCARTLQKCPGIVLEGAEPALVVIVRWTVVRHHLAERIIRLEVEPPAKPSPHFHNPRIVVRERSVLQQVRAHDVGVWEPVNRIELSREAAARIELIGVVIRDYL